MKPQIVTIGSGKGGVGKSTVAVNLARALKTLGKKVGLLDSDVYGPSFPTLFHAEGHRAKAINEKQIEPYVWQGIPTMSMGYLVTSSDAMIWRGPMLSSALMQMLEQTAWPSLDLLIIDLPPGTGDIPLTLAKKVEISGAIVVTTPQRLALADAHRAVGMFQKLKVPLIGLVENMSYHDCRECGERHALFGEADLNPLVQIPIDSAYQEVLVDSERVYPFAKMAQKVIEFLKTKPTLIGPIQIEE